MLKCKGLFNLMNLAIIHREAYTSGMKTKTAISYFKTPTKLARALGIKQSSIYDWGEFAPPLRQLQIEILTNGALKASSKILPKPNRKKI